MTQEVEGPDVDDKGNQAHDAELENLAIQRADDTSPTLLRGSGGGSVGHPRMLPVTAGSLVRVTAPVPAPGGFPVVGIVGGGQLARMCAAPAAELAVTLSVLAEAPDASAAQVIASAPVGSHADIEAVLAFARECDVVTFDHEQVPTPVLAALVDAGVVLHPSPQALVFAQDKLVMRTRLTELGIPTPRRRCGH